MVYATTLRLFPSHRVRAAQPNATYTIAARRSCWRAGTGRGGAN